MLVVTKHTRTVEHLVLVVLFAERHDDTIDTVRDGPIAVALRVGDHLELLRRIVEDVLEQPRGLLVFRVVLLGEEAPPFNSL